MIAAGAVEADRRSIHEHGRGRGTGLERIHQQARGLEAAVLQNLEMVCRPTLLGDRLPRQIHHAIRLLQGRQQGGVPPAVSHSRVELQPGQASVSTLCRITASQATADKGEAMAGLQQLRHQLPSHKASATQQQQMHQFDPLRPRG